MTANVHKIVNTEDYTMADQGRKALGIVWYYVWTYFYLGPQLRLENTWVFRKYIVCVAPLSLIENIILGMDSTLEMEAW